MAIIDFQVLGNNTAVPAEETLSGSGVGFFGSTAGSSVAIGQYQDRSNVASSDGSTVGTALTNIKFTTGAHPSGRCTVDATGPAYSTGLSGVPSFESTLGIRFGHTTEVNVQNCQLRVFDRSFINNPASGVYTKVAEIVNFQGSTYNSQGSAGTGNGAVGSGDAFWWGEPWPQELVGTNSYYTNSLGVEFYNGRDNETAVNGDSRLSAGSSDETVGGSGIVVPLLDSPGSGQQGLQANQVISGTGMVWPKWTQYINTTGRQQLWAGSTAHQFGDGATAANRAKNYGGTGVYTHHTWAVALSASPISLGAKEQYGLYVSLEYL